MVSVTELYNGGQIIWCTLKGFFDLQKTIDGVDEFEASMGEHTAHQILVIDSTDLAVFRQEILPVLERCYTLYSKFERCLMIEAENPIVNIQLKKTAKKVEGFTGEFIATREEVKTILGL